MHHRTFARVAPMRAKVFFYIFLALAIGLTGKLYWIQVVDGPVLAREALAQRSDTVDVFARRGSILDRDGNVLVRSLPSESVYVDPHDIADPDLVVARLTAIFGQLSPDVIGAIHDKHVWFYWVGRKVSHDIADRVRALDLTGVLLKQEDTGRRIDTVGDMASTLLGFVGTDENGLDGIEYEYDDLLKGVAGRVTIEDDDYGRPIPFGLDRVVKAAQPGLNLELTINSYLQFETEEALDQEVKASHAIDGTAIVMDPWTGEVLAMANVPHFDPNHFWTYSDSARRDRAVMDAYEPGSTFKLVTAAAALESGKVTPETRFPDRDELEVGGHIIHNADDGFMGGSNGSETLGDIIKYSHNVGAAEVGMAIGAKTFYDMEQRAGFGEPSEVGLPGENPGIVPDPSQWSDSSLATMAFGQGVSVTPIAMARYYCAIANGGILMRPRILRAILGPNGRTIYQYGPEIERRIFSQRTAAILQRYLRNVVVSGTGNPTAQIPGYMTSGKTGTAQMVVNGRYAPGAYAPSFIGYIPSDHPKYVIFVKIERPVGAYYGGLIAAPVFTRIARAAMMRDGILPTQTPMPSTVVKR